jgi:hypothetical protein
MLSQEKGRSFSPKISPTSRNLSIGALASRLFAVFVVRVF